ncbi:hypothetical protein [Aristophania vespae]|uniref:hypothetical protein n=1 Tax=Aristophania vespae TaxID=2697033 RepID=UPI0023510FAB|nr:hypothetical protein [Aristophania vespae]UMM64499.1 hypothetical protein DM15PD_15140 [Aristophania vespae]
MAKKDQNPTLKLFYTLLEREDNAAMQLEDAEKDLMNRLLEASYPNSGDDVVEEFSRWLPIGRRNIDIARQRLASISLERGFVRQALVLEASDPSDSGAES